MTDQLPPRFPELAPLVQVRVTELINACAANAHVDPLQFSEVIFRATGEVREYGRSTAVAR